MISAIGMTVSQLLVAVLGTTTTGQDANGNVFSKNLAAQKASIAFVCIYIFFFASTWVRLPPPSPLFLTPLRPFLPSHYHYLANTPQGSHRLGCYGRDLPPQSPRQVPQYDHSNKLAPQLGNRLLNTLSRQLRPRKRKPPIQNLLHLVRMLLPLHYVRLFHDLRGTQSVSLRLAIHTSGCQNKC